METSFSCPCGSEVAAEGEWTADQSADLMQRCPDCGEEFIITLTSLGKASSAIQADGGSQGAVGDDASSSSQSRTEPLGVGETAPEFELRGVHAGEIGTYTLEELTEDGPVLIAVYPFDFSPVCTQQLCNLQGMDWYGYKIGLSIVAVGADGPYSHMAFAEQEDLDLPLLCDLRGGMLRDYGAIWETVDGFDDVPRRAYFLVDEDRTITYRWAADDNWDESENIGLDPVGDAIRTL